MRRSSPNCFFISINSVLMIFRISCSLAKIPSSFAIIFNNSANSSSIFWRSRPVSVRSCIAKIAFAWISDSLNLAIKLVWASSALLLARIVLMTSSMWSRAILRPSRMWARSCALRSSYSVRRRTTTCRCFRYSWRMSCKPSTRGWIPSTSANIL